MHRSRSLLPLVIAASLASSAAEAGPVKVLGFDDMSCQAWTKSKEDSDARGLYVTWVRGVLTGHNYASQSRQVSVISSGTVEMFVNRYCAERPAGQLDEAAFRLSDQFSGRNSPITK